MLNNQPLAWVKAAPGVKGSLSRHLSARLSKVAWKSTFSKRPKGYRGHNLFSAATTDGRFRARHVEKITGYFHCVL